jgi:hypothetical protein
MYSSEVSIVQPTRRRNVIALHTLCYPSAYPISEHNTPSRPTSPPRYGPIATNVSHDNSTCSTIQIRLCDPESPTYPDPAGAQRLYILRLQKDRILTSPFYHTQYRISTQSRAVTMCSCYLGSAQGCLPLDQVKVVAA